VKLEVSVSIDAPPEKVWQIMTDVERWPEWTESIKSVERLDEEDFMVGSRARVRQPRLPTVVWKVNSLEPGRSFSWEAGTPGARSVAGHRVQPREGGSSVTLSMETRGVLNAALAPLMAGMTRRYMEMEAAGLKQRAESS
jgi:uncharacterized membrane protein